MRDKYDPNATGLIEFDKVIDFIMDIVDFESPVSQRPYLFYAKNSVIKAIPRVVF